MELANGNIWLFAGNADSGSVALIQTNLLKLLNKDSDDETKFATHPLFPRSSSRRWAVASSELS